MVVTSFRHGEKRPLSIFWNRDLFQQSGMKFGHSGMWPFFSARFFGRSSMKNDGHGKSCLPGSNCRYIYLDIEVRNIITRSYDFTNEAVITNKPETSNSFFGDEATHTENEVDIVHFFSENTSSKKTRVWATA